MSEQPREAQIQDPGASLSSTLKDSDLSAVVAGVLEIPLDEALDSGLLKDVPVFGSLLGLWNTGRGIRDYLFMKKLLAFLQSLSDVPAGVRGVMIRELEEDPRFERRVGERILILFERVESVEKATLAGRAFAAYCRGAIDTETLQRLVVAIERVPLSDIHRLQAYRESGSTGPVTLQEFVAAGLVLLHHGMATVHYKANEPLCDAMLQHVLRRAR